MQKLIFLIPIFCVGIIINSVYAETISLNSNSYVFGDVITVTGRLSYSADHFIGLQILNPSKSDIVVIDQFMPKTDGTFSKSLKAQGPKWNIDGIYTLRLVYDEHVFEKTFQFKTENHDSYDTPPNLESRTKKELENSPKSDFSKKFSLEPKLLIKGFPDPNKSPNYYFDRYYNEPEYNRWIEQTFSGYSIEYLVGYNSTHVSGFPDNKLPPVYYVERYNTEETYRDWFDSQFPKQTIYDVLGYPESLFHKVPNWVKNNAQWWSSDLISDTDFLNGISFLIKEGILTVPEYDRNNLTHTHVPLWIKNTAKWWADDLIDENEFLKGIQFLLENGIIQI